MIHPGPSGLYAIVDDSGGDLVEPGRRLLAHGLRTLQLRAKNTDRATLIAAGRALLPLARARGARLIINDDLQAAVEIGADGLHLGQEDGPLAAARARLPPGAWLGRSTHSLKQATDAIAEGADYIGFGPLFATQSKQAAGAPRGLVALAEVCRLPIAVVAIGGVDAQTVRAVAAAGAQSWAVIKALRDAVDLSAMIGILDDPHLRAG
jgi:thiamine-phosphate diphosphorylase